MTGLPPIPVTEREDSMRLLYLVLDDANHTFGPPIPKGQKPRLRGVIAGTSLFVALGIFFGFAIGLTRDLEPIAETTRQQLLERITDVQANLVIRQTELEDNVKIIDDIRLNASNRSTQIQRITDNIAKLSLNVGYTELRGDGLKVSIQPSVNPSIEDGVDLGVVIDSDIARVVNGLFANGADAISVNGYRITGKTAIRSAGEAILIGYQAVSPPYEILAIGNAQRMLSELRDGRTGEDITEIGENYGVRFSFVEASQIVVPASVSPLRNQISVRIVK